METRELFNSLKDAVGSRLILSYSFWHISDMELGGVQSAHIIGTVTQQLWDDIDPHIIGAITQQLWEDIDDAAFRG